MTSADRVIAAIRHVHEGGEATLERLATIAGRSPRRLAELARAQNWRMAAGSDGEVLERRLAALQERLIGDLEALLQSVCDGAVQKIDKARIDTFMALVKMAEKVGETMRTGERAKEKQIRDDAELAAALERIDDQIDAVARLHAASMGA